MGDPEPKESWAGGRWSQVKSNFASRKVHHMLPYEECAGLSTDITIEEDGLIARVGNVNLILPLEMEPTMRQFMGKGIAILRTDIANKQYIIRMLVENYRIE